MYFRTYLIIYTIRNDQSKIYKGCIKLSKTSLNTAQSQNSLSVLPLRDVVVFPNMVIPLFVGRENSIVALDIAMNSGKEIL